MLVLDWDTKFSNAQYEALTDDIVIDDLAGARSVSEQSGPAVKYQRRKYCRYVRNDIQAGVSDNWLVFRRKFTPVRLVDVSQFGVSIGWSRKLKCGQQLKLALTFEDGQCFEFDGVIVNRRSAGQDMVYGLKFERANRQFEEHLLKTGLKIKLYNRSFTA